MFNLLKIKEKVSMPIIESVVEDVVGFRPDHQGLTKNHSFYSKSDFLGSVQTELWTEDNLLLIHSIGASIKGAKHGTAMINWLVNHSTYTIQPVHVFGGGIGFWQKLEKIWPDRINSADLRSSEYDFLLEKRKQ